MSSRFLRGDLRGLNAYVPGEQPKDGSGVIKLNTNENPFPPPEKAVKAAESALSRVRLYPDPNLTDLKAALERYYRLPPGTVSLTNGSDEGLAFIFIGFCEAGAAFADVTYGFYRVLADLFRVPYTAVPLRADFSPDIADYAAVKGTVILANPNAPTGMGLPIGAIETLLNQNPDRLVVVDEAYAAFGGESCLRLIGRYDNLCVVSTFSKNRSMAGARLGLVAANPALMADFERIRCSFNPYNVNAATLKLGEYSVYEDEYYRDNIKKTIENRAFLVAGLDKLGFTTLPSQANFILTRPPGGQGKAYYERLKKDNILVRYFETERLKSHVRVSVGTRADMAALLDKTAGYLREGLV
ncbi:MAG: aminotransferase class I/II-fold pyridoxal phosphate-dependent enzyme [Clostridiales bacterium]|jgi:histidinol-phosphate aminotransferase|nr:aminotransferase class I/II-fold pyridoxal phosphate-dependent enzyme [Clostridiales bacterium]